MLLFILMWDSLQLVEVLTLTCFINITLEVNCTMGLKTG